MEKINEHLLRFAVSDMLIPLKTKLHINQTCDDDCSQMKPLEVLKVREYTVPHNPELFDLGDRQIGIFENNTNIPLQIYVTGNIVLFQLSLRFDDKPFDFQHFHDVCKFFLNNNLTIFRRIFRKIASRDHALVACRCQHRLRDETNLTRWKNGNGEFVLLKVLSNPDVDDPQN